MENYKVVKRIGVGTYGSAYLVTLKRDPVQQYVLKKIKIDEANEKERMQAETEVTVLKNLDHPLVLSYIDHFMYKGYLCIVTDFCEAGDLWQLLCSRKTPLLEGQVLELLAQLLLAIQSVHAKGILHRDLKSQNIFLTKEGTIKLGDFGISRSLNSSMDLASTIIGTPYYMSPEVMSSMPYDFKSDMWSMGCCLYEMMTLKHAFDASDLTSLVLKVMRGEHLPIPDQFSAELRDLAKQLLNKNPKMRPSPEQCLKAPFLKDHVSRAREKVAWLEQHRAVMRWRSPPKQSHPHSLDNGTGRLASVGRPPVPILPSTSGDAPANLDRELYQAKERLKRIQVQREALRAGSMKDTGQHSLRRAEYNSGVAQGRQIFGDGPQVTAYGRRSQPSEIAGPGHDLSGYAPDRNHAAPQQVLRRASQPGDTAAYGQRVHTSTASAGGAHASDAMNYNTDPKARKEAKKAEEIKKREAELLEARKAYFEERRTAEVKARQLYQSSSSVAAGTGSRSPLGGGVGLGIRAGGEAAPAASYGSSPSGPPGGAYGSYFPHAMMEGLSLMDSSGDEDVPRITLPVYQQPVLNNQHRYASSDPAVAQQEFESEFADEYPQPASSLNGGGDLLMRTYDAPGTAITERAFALRSYCISALGQQLFDLIYGALRRRVGLGVGGSGGVMNGDDMAFRHELQTRLGPSRMQYVPLIDQVIYFEDASNY